MRKIQDKYYDDLEIAPAKVYFVYYAYDKDGRNLIPVTYSGSSTPVEYSTLEDAVIGAKHVRDSNPLIKSKGKVLIRSMPFDEVMDYYQKPYGGRKRSRDPGRRFEMEGGDEIEPRSLHNIYIKEGREGLRQYLEGIPRKRKSIVKKVKRKSVKKCRCK